MDMNKVRSRFQGCLLAGAAGDALGYPVEFDSYTEILKRYGDGGITAYDLAFDQEYAVITDDTQMTLFTAAGLLEGVSRHAERSSLDTAWGSIYEAYLDWLYTQDPRSKRKRGYTKLMEEARLYARRAPGNTCLAALRSGECGDVDEPINHSKGCGGVMRVAPVGLYFPPDAAEEDVLMLGARAAAITHGHPLGYLPGAALAYIVWRSVYAQEGTGLREILLDCACAMQRVFEKEGFLNAFQRLMDKALLLAKNDALDVDNIGELGEGWVGDEALAIAVYCCLRHENNLDAALIAAVNHKGDSDSTGAVAGNIMGALLGREAIGEKWLEKLELTSLIEKIADDMYDHISRSDLVRNAD